jgi:hypothetical protein
MSRYDSVCTDSLPNMIPLEKQVCSLELARKLKDLGVKQESYFYWFSGAKLEATAEEAKVNNIWMLEHRYMAPYQEHYSAFDDILGNC